MGNVSLKVFEKSLNFFVQKRVDYCPSRLVREFKTVLDSGFHALDSRFFVSGTWIPGFQLLVGFQIP